MLNIHLPLCVTWSRCSGCSPRTLSISWLILLKVGRSVGSRFQHIFMIVYLVGHQDHIVIGHNTVLKILYFTRSCKALKNQGEDCLNMRLYGLSNHPMSVSKCKVLVSWAERKDPRNVPYPQKAYLSKMLCTHLLTTLLVSMSPLPRGSIHLTGLVYQEAD